MPRCPECLDELGDEVLACGTCGASLAGETPHIRLGRFHPAIAERVTELLAQRGVDHGTVEQDDDCEIRVDPRWRDDVRAELTLTWSDLLASLDPDVEHRIRERGGHAPGWYDAPQGGFVDRAGRLVVSAVEDDEEETRIVGPALLTGGAILAVVGWYVLDSGATAGLGAALAVLGLLTPR